MRDPSPKALGLSWGSSDASARGSTSPLSGPHASSSSSNRTMLSVDFSTPLAGPARSARIKQMSHNHPAFEKSRMTQEILVKIQHSLRRMPGVSAGESGEIIAQLQEVGQVISQETSQLVDALMNLTLDQEDTDRSIARMAIEANLAKAGSEDQAQEIKDLGAAVQREKMRSEAAEGEMRKMLTDLEHLTLDFKKLKETAARGDGGDRGLDKGLEGIIQDLEEQVNKHRTLWVMRRSNPEMLARAIESVHDAAAQDKRSHARPSMSLLAPSMHEMMKTAETAGPPAPAPPPPPRAPSVFQPIHRPMTAGPPPKFGQLQSGPLRPPSVMAHERRGPPVGWGDRSAGQHSRPGSLSGAQPPYAQSSFRAPSRKGLHQNSSSNSNVIMNSHHHHQQQQQQHAQPPRYRNDFTAPENHTLPQQQRPSSSFGYGSREPFPNTPTASGRSRYGRSPAPPPAAGPGPTKSASMVDFSSLARPGGGGSSALEPRYSGPPIAVTERTVAGWHEQIMELYGVIRTFVERHANRPDTVRGIRTHAPGLWPILLATYHPLSEAEATSYLEFHVRNENSKSCLVTRVMIDFIVNRVWVPGAWSGADAESTYALVELEADLERTAGQPSVLRQPLLDRQACILESILQAPSHGLFLQHKTEETASALLLTLQPLLNAPEAHPAAAAGDAYADMLAVAEHAWALSGRLLTSRLTFDFRFPEIGSRFSSQSMLPIWPRMEPLELQAKHWRVALVTTPVVTCRNDTGSNISAHSVSLADVFCMQ